MDIEEVSDAESLKTYLDTLDPEDELLTAHRVGFRAAARVLPTILEFFFREEGTTKSAVTTIPVLRALAVASVKSSWPTPTVDNETAAAALAAAGAASREARPDTVISRAGYSAAIAVASDSANAGNAADCTKAANPAAWEAVRADLEWSADNPNCRLPALWQGVDEPTALSIAWKNASAQMKASTADWNFWILWFERVRAGRDFHADKLAEILNPLCEDDWKKGPAHINPLFDDLLALYREEDAALEAELTPLSQAYFADFSFDALAKVMVMIGIDNDTTHLRAPEVVQAFLDDSEELRDLLQDFADDARALSGGNYAGVLQRKAEKLLAEFQRAGETTHLRARTIVTYCSDLELHAQEEKARNDLGQTLSKQLDQRVGLLKRLCLQHFGPAYLALAPLAEMPREHVDQAEVVRLLDLALEQMRAPSRNGFVALDPEGVAVFEEMIRGLEATRAAIAEADSAEFRELLEARFAQSSGSIGVTALRYFEKSVVAGGQTADALIKANKRVSGLQDIVNRLKDWLPEGWP